jgi:hypothetical protein
VACALSFLLAWLLLGAPPAFASATPAPPPLLQSWSDTGLISVDDDWSRVPGVVGYRGDGLVPLPGVDPRTVLADGSGTPVDVTANRIDPRAVGLASGVAEFELADPVVAIQGSSTASAPHVVLSLDTRGRAGVSVRLALRDIDASGADAVSAVALQYRVGASGDFAEAPGGYVADATSGPSTATLVTPIRTMLPAGANDKPLVQVRVITTNAAGQDEWVGIDDVDVTAATAAPTPPPPCPAPPGPVPPRPRPRDRPPLELTALRLRPDTFTPMRRGAAIVRRGGVGLRFRLSRAALVRLEVIRVGGEPGDFAPKPDAAGVDSPKRDAAGAHSRKPRTADLRPLARVRRNGATTQRGRFTVRGKRGVNRLRFSGRIRGRPLAAGEYVLRAVAADRAGRRSAPATVRFQIGANGD